MTSKYYQGHNGLRVFLTIMSALIIAVIVTVSSGYVDTFAKVTSVQNHKIEINKKINSVEKKVIVLETNYKNIITLLEDIKEGIK